MIDAKDVARKIVNGCGHIQPIIVPCQGCIESHMAAWEVGIKDAAKQEFISEWRRLSDDLDKANAEVMRVKQYNERLVNTLTDAQNHITGLKNQLSAAQVELSGLKAQLHAEQAVKSLRKMARA